MQKSLLCLPLLLLLFSCQQPNGEQKPEHILRFGHIANERNIWHLAALKFAEEVHQRSGGRIEVKIYANEQLGNEMDMVTSIMGGSLDLMITAELLQNWSVPNAVLCATPYAIRDSEHLRQVADGPVGKAIEDQMLQVTGLRPLAWFERGARNLTSNRPIRHPDDLNGMILRVPSVPLFVSTWSALGAKPTPMAFSEVFTALQQNTIQGQENPFALIRSAGLYEVQRYCNLTEHVKSWIYVVIGNRRFEKLPPDLQQAVLEAAKAMQAYEHALFLEQEEKEYLFLKEKGMEFIEVDKAAFAQRAQVVVDKFLTGEPKELYNQIQALP
jgi:TRAP-type transport system periplasmic protein